jgi:hypothetical protein
VQGGDGLVAGVQVAQGVGHRAGGVGDDERVARVGLGLPGIQVGDPAHRQSGKVGDQAAGVAGHGHRQRPDRGGLVDHDQHLAVLGELGEQRAQLRLAVGQRPVGQALAARCQRGGVVFALAHVQAQVDRDVPYLWHISSLHGSFIPAPNGTRCQHPRYEGLPHQHGSAVQPLSAVYRCLQDR